MIFHIIGKSATGKDSIYKKIIDKNLGLQKIILYTTRPKRDGEIDGVEYYFVDENYLNFNSHKIIEKRVYHTIFGDWYYATLDDGQIVNEKNYIMIGTLDSYNSLKKFFGEENIFPIYLYVDNAIRRNRALNRENEQKIPQIKEMERRFLADEIDFSDEKLKKAKIEKKYINDDIDICINEILKDIKKYINV